MDFLSRFRFDTSQPQAEIQRLVREANQAAGTLRGTGVQGRRALLDLEQRGMQSLVAAHAQSTSPTRNQELLSGIRELRAAINEMARRFTDSRRAPSIQERESARRRVGGPPISESALQRGAEDEILRSGGVNIAQADRLRALRERAQRQAASGPQRDQALLDDLRRLNAAYRRIPEGIRRALNLDITELRQARESLDQLRRPGSGANFLIGLQAAQRSEIGSRVSVARELGLARADGRVGSRQSEPGQLSDLSAQAAQLARRRQAAETLALERRLAADQGLTNATAEAQALRLRRNTAEKVALERQLAGDQQLTQATAEAAALRRERNLRERAATERLQQSQAPLAAEAQFEAERRRALEQQALYRRTIAPTSSGVSGVEELAAGRAAQAARAAQINASTQSALGADRAYIEATAQAAAARRRLQAAVAARERELLAQSGLGGTRDGTLFQRLQANIAQRSGTGLGRGPADFATLGQYLSSRALTTAGFAASGALLYGGVNFIGDIIKESTQLQQELRIVRTQMDDIAGAGDGSGSPMFDRYLSQLRDISHEAGVVLTISAPLTRQLAGAFADPDTGVPDYAAAIREGSIALKSTQITQSLSPQEITDDLTAIALAFDINFERIQNGNVGLSESFGVVEDEIANFTSRLAPLAAELGFTYEQLAGLGAVAQQGSGLGGTALAEQFGRILPALQSRRADLINIFRSNTATAGQAPDLLNAFEAGDTPEVLRQLIDAYGSLTEVQKNQLASLVGSRREAGAFYTVLERGGATLRALSSDEEDYAGKFEARWEGYTTTVDYAIDRLKVAAQDFGRNIFEAGLGDAIKFLAQNGDVALQVMSSISDVAGMLNDTLGGLPGKILAVAVALRAFRAVAGAARGSGIAQGAAGWFTGLTNPGGALSPFQAPGVAPPASGLLGPTGAPLPPQPPPPVLRPGAPAGLAGAGRIGSAAAGLSATALANLPGLLSTVAVTFAVMEVSRIQAELQGIRGDVEQQAATLFEEGISRAEARARLEAVEPQGSSLRDKVGAQISGLVDMEGEAWTTFGLGLIPVAGPLLMGRRVLGTDPRADARQEAIDKAIRSDRGADLVQFFGEMRTEDLNDLADRLAAADTEISSGIDAALAGVLDDIEGTGNRARLTEARESLGLAVGASTEEARAAIQSQIDTLAEDPANEEAIDTLADLKAGVDRETAREIQKILDNLTLRPELEEQAGESKATVDLLKARVEAGEIGPGPLIDALREQIAFQETMVEAFPDETQYRQQLAELRTELTRFTTQRVVDSLDFSFQVGDLSGLNLEDRVAMAQRALTQLQGLGAPIDQQLQMALRIAQLNREAVLEAMGDASSPEAVAALAEGLELPPEVRAVMAEAELTQGAASTVIAAIQRNGESDEAFQDLVREWAAAMAETGRIPEELRARLVERAAWLQELVDGATYFVGGKELADIQAEIDRINGFLADGIPGVSGIGGAAADAAAGGPDPAVLEQERAAIQSAGDLARARAGDDQVGAAKAELDTASQLLERETIGTRGYDEAMARYLDAKRNFDTVVRDQAARLADSFRAVERARAAGDPIALANLDIAAALDAQARATTQEEANFALAQLITARKGLEDVIRAQEQARIDYLIALAGDDPAAVAGLQIQAAQMAAAAATVGTAEWYGAMSQLVAAQQAQRDAQRDIEAARLEMLGSTFSNNAVRTLELQIQAARDAVSQAEGAAEQYRAQAELNNLQRQYQEAILDVAISQKELAIAMFNAAGDGVAAAQVQLQIALTRLNQLRNNGAGAAELNRAQAEIVAAQAALRDARYNEQIGDIDFALQMERITTQEAIRQLEALLLIPGITKQQTQELLLKIKSLRDDLGRDLRFNLPDFLAPTLYEARRATQYGLGGIQDARTIVTDNRQIILQVDAAGADAAQVVDLTLARLGEALEAAPTNSVAGRML